MKYVYLLQSIPHPEQRYIGLTSDPQKPQPTTPVSLPTQPNIAHGKLLPFTPLSMRVKLWPLKNILSRVPEGHLPIRGSGNIEIR